jgi:methionine-rich copper-binding protein CopC
VIKVENPQLEAGRNEIRWVALSKDGHVIKGVIELTVKPAATKA